MGNGIILLSFFLPTTVICWEVSAFLTRGHVWGGPLHLLSVRYPHRLTTGEICDQFVSRVDLMLTFLELVAASSMDTNRRWPRFEWSEKDSGSMFTTLTVKMKSTYHPWSALTLQSGSSNGLQTRIKKGRDQPETEKQQLYRWRGEFGK